MCVLIQHRNLFFIKIEKIFEICVMQGSNRGPFSSKRFFLIKKQRKNNKISAQGIEQGI